MIWALDYLGGCKYKDLILREHPGGWGAGLFAVTFGNAYPVAEALAASGRCPLLRIQLLWSDSHSFGDNDIKTIRKLARQYEALAQRFPSIAVELSPFCEHNIKNPDKYLDIVKYEAPSCVPVNCPWKGGFSARYKNEVHGTHAKPKGSYNYSFDGTNCVDSDVEKSKKIYADSDVYFFWHPSFNGKLKNDDTTPRPQRKSWPTPELIDSIIYLHRDAGSVSLSNKHIWKSHADRHMTPPEPRAYKPVFITDVKANHVELVADNGQVIAVSSGRQPFGSGGQWRYYFSGYGYQLAEKAKRIHGKPTAALRANGKVIGVVNPAFRAGSFRG